MKYFFEFSTLPRYVNATRIALVPKIENPLTMNDFRPVFCCNVMYKCISKVIVSMLQLILLDVIGLFHIAFVLERQISDAILLSMLQLILLDVIGLSHTAFVFERQISDVILLTHELMHNYYLPDIMFRCALQIDIKKAFDTVNWEFILLGLKIIGVPNSMIRWIKVGMSTVHFSMAMNGEQELHGFF